MNHVYNRSNVGLFIAIFLLFACINVYGQRAFLKKIDNNTEDYSWGVAETADRGIVITGSEKQGADRPLTVVELDSAGNYQTTHAFNIIQDGFGEGGYRIKRTIDNGFIISGYQSNLDAGANYTWYAMKLDQNFSMDWDHPHFFFNPFAGAPYFDIIQLPDSMYYTVGYYSGSGYGRKYDQSGAYVFHKGYRNVKGQVFENTQVRNIVLMRSGNFLMPGRNIDSDNAQLGPMWVEGDGVVGTNIGHELYYLTDGTDAELFSAAHAKGGYMMSGKNDDKLLLVKIDETRDTVWTKRISVDVNVTDLVYASIVMSNDGNNVIQGTYEDNTGQRHTFLMKVDENGSVLWTKYFTDTLNGDDLESYDIKVTSEGGFMITGYHINQGGTSSDHHVIKTDAEGELCDNFPGILEVTTDTTLAISIPITFTAKIVGGTGSITYRWDFGDGNTQNGVGLQAPQHTYATPGTYNLFLETEDGNGCIAHYSDSITITPPHVIADFSYVITGLDVCFTDLSLNNPDSLRWDFGDGAWWFQDSLICHSYISDGKFEVCLGVNNTFSSDTTCDSITLVLQAPTADFCYVTNGLTVTFYDQSTNAPVNWFWDNGDGSPLVTGVSSHTHTYATAGLKFVSLTVVNGQGSDNKTEFVTVQVGESTPEEDISYTNSGLTVNFTDQSSNNPNAWLWDFGDGNTLDNGTHAGSDPIDPADDNGGLTGGTYQDPSHTYPARGSYTVCLEASIKVGASANNDGCSDSCFTVNVITPPIAGWTADTSGGLVVQFTDTSWYMTGAEAPLSWAWDFDNDAITDATVPNPTFIFPSTGVYMVCLTVTNVDGSDTFCRNLNVADVPPVALFSWVDNGNLTVDFTDQSLNGPTDWDWDFGDTNTDNVQHPSHTYAAQGPYNVCLEVENASGSDDTCIMINVVVQPPVANFGADQTQICINESVSFTDSSTNLITTWSWDFGAGATPPNATGQGPHNVTYTTAGQKTVTLDLTGPGGTDSKTRTNYIDVNNPPVTSAITGNDTVCQNALGEIYSVTDNPASTFSWSVPTGATITSGQTTHSITVDWGTASSGNVEVTETLNGCDGTPVSLSVFVKTSPVTSAINGPAAVCENVTGIDYWVTDNPGSTFNWTVGGSGTIQSGNGTDSIVVDWGSTGGDVEVTETDSLGCSGVTQTLTVAVEVPINLVITGPTTVCEGETRTYSVQNTVGSSYNWNVSGGTISSGQTSSTVTVNWGSPGAGSVDVTETTSGGCVGTLVSESVTINAVPTTSAISGDDSTCVGDTELYSVSVTAGSSYNWTVPGGTINSGQGSNSISVTWNTAGSHTIDVVETNNANCVGATVSLTVEVSAAPTTSAITGSNTACETEVLTYSVTNTPGSDYNWNISGGTINSGQGNNSVTVTWTSAGNRSIEVTETNAGGCIGTPQSLNVTVTDCTPEAEFTCVENLLTVDFTDQSTNATTWSWEFGDGNTDNAQHPQHIYSSAGTYNICLTVSNSIGQTDSTCHTKTLIDQPKPVANFTCMVDSMDGLMVHFTDKSTNNPNMWDWAFGDGGTSTMQHPTHTYNKYGIYIVTLTATNTGGFHAASKEVVLNKHIVGLDEAEAEKYVKIYPVPTRDDLFVQVMGGMAHEAIVSVYDLSGKQLQVPVRLNQDRYKIDMNDQASGMYIVKCELPDLVIMKQVIVAH